jgi:hypothetical protein
MALFQYQSKAEPLAPIAGAVAATPIPEAEYTQPRRAMFSMALLVAGVVSPVAPIPPIPSVTTSQPNRTIRGPVERHRFASAVNRPADLPTSCDSEYAQPSRPLRGPVESWRFAAPIVAPAVVVSAPAIADADWPQPSRTPANRNAGQFAAPAATIPNPAPAVADSEWAQPSRPLRGPIESWRHAAPVAPATATPAPAVADPEWVQPSRTLRPTVEPWRLALPPTVPISVPDLVDVEPSQPGRAVRRALAAGLTAPPAVPIEVGRAEWPQPSRLISRNREGFYAAPPPFLVSVPPLADVEWPQPDRSQRMPLLGGFAAPARVLPNAVPPLSDVEWSQPRRPLVGPVEPWRFASTVEPLPNATIDTSRRDDLALQDIEARLWATDMLATVVRGASPDEVLVAGDVSTVAWLRRTRWTEASDSGGDSHDRTVYYSLWLAVRGASLSTGERFDVLGQIEATVTNAITRQPIADFCQPAFSRLTRAEATEVFDGELRVELLGELRYEIADAVEGRPVDNAPTNWPRDATESLSRDDFVLRAIERALYASGYFDYVALGGSPDELAVAADRGGVAWVRRDTWTEAPEDADPTHERAVTVSIWVATRGADPTERHDRLVQLEAAALNSVSRQSLGGVTMPAFTVFDRGEDLPLTDLETRARIRGTLHFTVDPATDGRPEDPA